MNFSKRLALNLVVIGSFVVSGPAGIGSVRAAAAPASMAQDRGPNELGWIPIIMYHAVGGPPEFDPGPLYDIHGLNISPATFRHQIQLMYDAGWYPVNVRTILSARINVPRGKTPVAITFDDARPSQFRYLPDGRLDPDCAVGILEAFHRAHPRDWPRRATFYIMPESKYNGVPFDQDGLERKKLRYLVRMGYEIGNHSLAHPNMSRLSASRLRWEMAECVRGIHRLVPHLKIDSMAIPYGVPPKDHHLWHWLLHGTEGGVTYTNRCMLLVGNGPSYSYVDKRFDRTRVPRIVPKPGNLETWIKKLQPGTLMPPFMSDGDTNLVTIPANLASFLDRSRLHEAGHVGLVVTPAQVR